VYPQILEKCLGPLLAQLLETVPQHEDSELQKLRHAALDALSKFPPAEAFRPYAAKVVEMCLKVLTSDNQQNGIIAIKTFIELHKLFGRNTPGMEHYYLQYADFVLKVGAHLPMHLRAVC
jgi:transformation/transcription domain-associated protein